MDAERIYRFGNFELDCPSGDLRRAGVRLHIQGKPLQLLTLLLECAPQVVSREQMRDRLWPADTFVDFDRNLNAAVKKLRETLSDSAATPRFVETMPRRGYRFIARVDVSSIQSHFSGNHEVDRPLPLDAAPAKPLGSIPSTPPASPRLLQRLLAAAAVTAALLMTSFHPTPSTPRKSECQQRSTLAVLPFQDVGHAKNSRVGEGFTDALTTRLVDWDPSRLGVVSRRSVEKYRCSSRSVAEIGRELGVTHVVVGTVRRDGSRLFVTAEFVNAADQIQIWSRSLELPADNLAAAQEELTRSLVSAVAACLRPPTGPHHVAALAAPHAHGH